ncbi:dienelactone hydrolase family protein [Oceanithermus sp.]
MKSLFWGQLAIIALLTLIACAATPATIEVVSGPASGSAITSSPVVYSLATTGAGSCNWRASANGVSAEGSCVSEGGGRYRCEVELPSPGLYWVDLCSAGQPGVTVDDLDYRPRYGGSYPPLDDGSGGIAAGWGAWGGSAVADPLTVNYPGKGTVTVYRPEVLPAPRPTIVFVSGWGRDADTYKQLFRYVASKGFVLVNVYNENPGDIVNTYHNAFCMVEDTLARHPGWIDTSRVGLMGHSMGGGMAFWLAVRLFAERGWGASGRFVFVTAPWYTFLTTAADLARVPADTRVLVQAYEEDLFTDPEVYQLVFRLLPTPAAEKDFVYVRSGNVGDYAYHANHFTSYTGAMTQWDPVHYEPYDRLDAYALNRLLDALTAYVFDGEVSAKAVALGGGAAEQVNVGPLPELIVTDDPDFHDPAVEYEYVCRDDNDEGWDDLDIWMLEDACP